MAVFLSAVCALGVLALVQVSLTYPCASSFPNLGCNDALILDVAPAFGVYGSPLYGYGNPGFELECAAAAPSVPYGYYGLPALGLGLGLPALGCGCDCCSEPFVEVTTVSCVPIVETKLEPAYGLGLGYNLGLYGGYPPLGLGYPGYGLGYGCGCL